MGKIKVHEFVTLDGVINAPTWTRDYGFPESMGEAIAGFMGSCHAILLGRRTYEEFAPAWSTRTAEEDPGAPFMNGTHKYVVSSSLGHGDWGPSTILGGYDPAKIQKVKDETGGDIYVSGSGTLVRAMISDGLVDELHLLVYPVTLGEGPRLFAEGMATRHSLIASTAFENGVQYLAYEPVSQ
jgi:dihydrofolate reductase